MFGKKFSLDEARAQMVEKQLVARNISDQHILKAMGEIPRHRFVDAKLWSSAYKDGPLSIGYNQTISQPYIVAFMTQSLCLPPNKPTRVLEIGTGCGYQTAILSRLASKVYSIERIPPLAQTARRVLRELNIHNVEIKVGDGGYGWQDMAPFDGIIVTAAAPEVPAPLVVQLKQGAMLVAPVGPRDKQKLLRLHWQGEKIMTENLVPVAFVPLLGEHGWAE